MVAMVDDEGEADDPLSLISLPTAASIAGVLALIAAWLAVIAVGGGLWLLARPQSVAASTALSRASTATWDTSQAPIVALALAASLTFLSVVLAMIVTWVRPLRSLVRATTLLIQGQWHRPIPQSIAAIAPVQQLAVIYEDLRGSLVDRLRSSTELNLQLESEVARRTAELERRSGELAALLLRLESTRSEILRSEKLATVGRVASDVAGSIQEPMAVLLSVPPKVGQAFSRLVALTQVVDSAVAASATLRTAPEPGDQGAGLTASPGPGPDDVVQDDAIQDEVADTLRELDTWLASVADSAARVSHVVRALRVYARPDALPLGSTAQQALTAPLAAAAARIDDEKADPSPTRLPPT